MSYTFPDNKNSRRLPVCLDKDFDIDDPIIRKLLSLGAHIEIFVTQPDGWSSNFWISDVESFEEFRKNPGEYISQEEFQVTEAQYQAWHDGCGHPRCCGKTPRGKRCKRLDRQTVLKPKDWIKDDQNFYCIFHKNQEVK